MRRKINSLSAAAMGKTGWRANPDPSIPVVPTHHILHNAWYNELQGEISRDRSTYLSVHLVPHYRLMWSAIGYKKDKCMAYICEQSEKQLLSFLQHCFPPSLTGDPTIPNFSMHCCCMQLWNHVHCSYHTCQHLGPRPDAKHTESSKTFPLMFLDFIF